MGYSHSFEYAPEAITPMQAMILCQDARQVIDNCGIPITGWDSRGSVDPEFNPEGRLAFNGVGADGCETFNLQFSAPTVNDDSSEYEKYNYELFVKNHRRTWGFCKTRLRPYDAVVTAVLLRAMDILGSNIVIGSDGSWTQDWLPGRHLYSTAFGGEASCPWIRD